MGHKFAEIAFTDTVKELQTANGSRSGYRGMEGNEDYNFLMSEREADFIGKRDSFYMASVSSSGWPYVQHRGGPAGFMKVIDARTIGFADYSGNRQYVSTGNFSDDDRVALFFMDYPNRTRLKMLGRVKIISGDDYETLAKLEDDHYRAAVERGFLITIEGFDWNCPQHITPRYSEAEVEKLLAREMANSAPVAVAVAQTSVDPDEALGNGPLALTISGVRQLTPRVRAYELRDPQGADLPAIEAGSHIKIPVRLLDGSLSARSYSICSNPARRDIYEIAVLREEDGTGGSVAVHQTFNIGMRLYADRPANYFSLHRDSRPSVLIAGGIGITPIKAMAQALSTSDRAFEMHYAGRSRGEMAFRDRLQRELGDVLQVYSAEDGERLKLKEILTAAHDKAQIYVCGPERLIGAVIDTARGLNIDKSRLHFERFE